VLLQIQNYMWTLHDYHKYDASVITTY